MMHTLRFAPRTGLLLLGILAVGSGTAWSQEAPASSTTDPQIAGEYTFTKKYLSNSCGANRELVDQSTAVTYDSVNSQFVFDDGVVTFRGRAERSGEFLADTVSGQDGDGNTLVVVLKGKFRASGFDASITVTQTPPATAEQSKRCAYAIEWTGTRIVKAASSSAGTLDLKATAPDGKSLGGSLYYPAGDGPVATVILVHGSEPGTRQHRGYKVWRDAIVAAGYACLVVDKRGTGESEGEYVEGPDFNTPATDFLAWIKVLKQQPRVRADAIGMLGWSQAGWIAPLVASRSNDVSFLVLISAPGVSPLEQNTYDKSNQVAANAPNEAQANLARAAVKNVMTYLVTGEGSADAEASWEAVSEQSWFKQAYTGVPLFERASFLSDPRGLSFVAHNAYDPVPALQSLKIPVLALFGSADRIVPVERSLAAMQDEIGKQAKLEYKIIEGGNHGLAVRDASGVSRFPPNIRPMIFEWIGHQVQ